MTKIKKLIWINWDDLALYGGVVAGVFLLLQLIIGGVMAVAKPDTSVMLSGIFLPITAGIMLLIGSMSHVMLTFPMALKFGQTRRNALGQVLGLLGFQALCTMGLAGLLTALERWVAGPVWAALSGAENGAVVTAIFSSTPEGSAPSVSAGVLEIGTLGLDWWWFPVIALGGVAAGMISGAVLQRFGGKGGWVLWAGWMALCFAPQLLQNVVLADDFFRWLAVVGVVSVFGGLIWSVWSLLHAAVKS